MSANPQINRVRSRLTVCVPGLGVLLGLAALTSGCNVVGYAAHVVGGGARPRTKTVLAEYRGLENKTVAVLVAVDEFTLFEHPDAASQITRLVCAQLLATDTSSIRVVDPQQIDQFTAQNPYWNTFPYQDLLNRLGVDRLLSIEVVRLSTHDPGNAHVWRGSLLADVGVVESESPQAFAYATTVQAQFPPNNPVGVLDADGPTIRLGVLKAFAAKLANLFQDHDVVTP